MSRSIGNRKENSALLISSSGGHWVQLCRIAAGLQGVTYDVATVDANIDGLNPRAVYEIVDFNRNTPFRALFGFWSVLSAVRKSKATHIVSTGAAPGLFAIAIGRLMGRRTLWIDSIANAERLSMSGRVAAMISHVTLTQWEEVAQNHSGVAYKGRVA